MDSQLVMPREGHLDAFLNVYALLRDRYNSRMAFDPTYPDINKHSFKECEWKELYVDCEEEIPSNAPKSRGKDFYLNIYVDSDHAG